MDRVTNADFNSKGHLGLPSSMSQFSLSNLAIAATTSKLDKDLQKDREHYKTHHCGMERDIACHLIIVICLNEIMSPISGAVSEPYNQWSNHD
jgi:hypothetical protein